MDLDEYVVARHPLLVRGAVLMGRPLEQARELVERVDACEPPDVAIGTSPGIGAMVRRATAWRSPPRAETSLAPALVSRTTVPSAVACGLRRPESLGRRVALELSLWLPTESGGCPLTVDRYRTRGAIDAVVVRSPRPQGTEPGGAP